MKEKTVFLRFFRVIFRPRGLSRHDVALDEALCEARGEYPVEPCLNPRPRSAFMYSYVRMERFLWSAPVIGIFLFSSYIQVRYFSFSVMKKSRRFLSFHPKTQSAQGESSCQYTRVRAPVAGAAGVRTHVDLHQPMYARGSTYKYHGNQRLAHFISCCTYNYTL